MKVYYLSYPYSPDKEHNIKDHIKEAIQLARDLMATDKELVPIIPHLTIDPLPPKAVAYCDFEWVMWIIKAELSIIAKADGFILGVDPKDASKGMTWECGFAMSLGKPVFFVDRGRDGKVLGLMRAIFD